MGETDRVFRCGIFNGKRPYMHRLLHHAWKDQDSGGDQKLRFDNGTGQLPWLL